MKKKVFVISIPDEINNRYLEELLFGKFNMSCYSSGCGTTEFYCEKEPKNFKRILRSNIGKIFYEKISFLKGVLDED